MRSFLFVAFVTVHESLLGPLRQMLRRDRMSVSVGKSGSRLAPARARTYDLILNFCRSSLFKLRSCALGAC